MGTMVYSLLRDMKLLMSVSGSGTTHSANVVKVFYILPVSFLFMVIYTKLDLKYKSSRVFYIFGGIFLTALFIALILFGIKDYVEVHNSLSSKETNNRFLRNLLVTLESWTVTYFFLVSELYSSVFLNLCIWGFSNSICSKDEALRFYPSINVFCTICTMLSGVLAIVIGLNPLPNSESKKGIQSGPQLIILSIVIVLNLGIIWIYRRFSKRLEKENLASKPGKAKKRKPKMGLKDSLVYIFTNSYVFNIMVMVASYGIIQGFFETLYGNNLKLFAIGEGIKKEVIKGAETLIGGFLVFVLLLLVGNRGVIYFGWTKTALVSPIVISLFGTAFLISNFANYNLMHEVYHKLHIGAKLAGDFTASELSANLLVYIFGTICVNLTRSLKYSFFDPTKELVFFPLDLEERGRAKAAVDVIGARIGKSGSSLIQIILLACFSNDIQSLKAISVMFVLVMILWIYCTIKTGTIYAQKDKEKEDEALNGIDEKETLKSAAIVDDVESASSVENLVS